MDPRKRAARRSPVLKHRFILDALAAKAHAGRTGLCFPSLFWVARAPSPPKVAVQPETVHFNGFGSKSQAQAIVVRNLGGSPLRIERVELMLPSHYKLADNWSFQLTGGNVDYAPLVVIPPGGVWNLKLSRTGGDWTDAGGTIRLFTDDPLAPGPVKIDVVATPFANATQCLTSQAGSIIDFGPAVPGAAQKNYVVHLKNCGAAPLVVTGVALVQDPSGSGLFAIDWEHSTKADGSSPLGPTPTTPIVVPGGGYVALTVTYAALNLTPETNGKLLVEVGGETYTFTLTAQNVKVTCPIPMVTVTEGEQVVPQTTIHLKGDQSKSAGGAITKYKWYVKQPAGSNQALTPNASFISPSLLANASGEYEFCLDVWDASGVKSCAPACALVLVIPNNAIHIELLWNTPADADQTDSGPAAGADLDLHFAHPIAGTADLDCDGKPDPWFSNPWDTFWFNAAPEWGGSGNTKDNPTMDLDDTDGAGPENLNLVDPEGTDDDPVAYRVGVHYWNDHGFSTSFATVNIYVQGGLAVQFSGAELQALDMWYVGDLNWPNVTNGGTKPVFQTCYQSGQSCAAGKNLMWEPKGERCITKCYKNKVFNGSVGGAAKPPGC